MENKTHILSTAFIDKQLIQKAAAKGIEIEVSTFIEIQPLTNEHLSNEIASLYTQSLYVVFTSVNAIPTAPDRESKWHIFCMGNATAKAIAEKFGSSSVAGTANNANELAELILKNREIKEVVFFCGDKRRDELPLKLREGHINVREIIVYRTIETPKKLAATFNGILFFSPSAVNSFFSANTIGHSTILFAIGNTTADAIKELSNNKVIVCEQPDKEQLVDIVLANYGEITMKTEQ